MEDQELFEQDLVTSLDDDHRFNIGKGLNTAFKNITWAAFKALSIIWGGSHKFEQTPEFEDGIEINDNGGVGVEKKYKFTGYIDDGVTVKILEAEFYAHGVITCSGGVGTDGIYIPFFIQNTGNLVYSTGTVINNGLNITFNGGGGDIDIAFYAGDLSLRNVSGVAIVNVAVSYETYYVS